MIRLVVMYMASFLIDIDSQLRALNSALELSSQPHCLNPYPPEFGDEGYRGVIGLVLEHVHQQGHHTDVAGY